MDELEKIRGEVEKVIPTAEFNALLGKVSGNFEKLIGKTKMRSLAPMLLAYLTGHEPDGKRIELPIMLTSLPDGEEKRKLLFNVGGQLAEKRHHMVACFMACEAWFKTMTPTEEWRSKSVGLQQPSKCPDRTEAVVIWGRTLDSRTNMALANIGRGKGGRIELGRWQMFECKVGQGKGGSVEDNMLSHLFAGYLIGMAKRIGGGGGSRS